jgi:hypothetical protein
VSTALRAGHGVGIVPRMSTNPRGRTALPPGVKAYFAKISRLGGQARAKKLSAAERSESAKKAAAARWRKTPRAKETPG